MKIPHLAIIIGAAFLVMAIAHPAFSQTSTDYAKIKCSVHITTRLHDSSYIQKAVQTARQSPDFAYAAKNDNFTFYTIYGKGQYDDTHCNNFYWSETDVVFSDNNLKGITHYLIAIEDPQLSGDVTVANFDDGPAAKFNDSFTGALTLDEFIRNSHNTTFGADYPPLVDATPLKQTEAGIYPSNVECRDGLHLLTKGHHGYCVRQSSIQRLVLNGWEDIKTYDTGHSFPWCQNYTSNIADNKVLLACNGPVGSFNLPHPTYVMKHCPGIYGCQHIFWYEETVPPDLLSEKQKEMVENMTLVASGINNDSRWSLDRFLVFASGNQWFSDVHLFINNGTANCGRYVQSEINLEDLEIMSSFSTDLGFSACKTEVSQSNNVTNAESANPLGITALVIYQTFLGCFAPYCPPNNFYLKINSNSSAYLLGYDICDGQL